MCEREGLASTLGHLKFKRPKWKLPFCDLWHSATKALSCDFFNYVTTRCLFKAWKCSCTCIHPLSHSLYPRQHTVTCYRVKLQNYSQHLNDPLTKVRANRKPQTLARATHQVLWKAQMHFIFVVHSCDSSSMMCLDGWWREREREREVMRQQAFGLSKIRLRKGRTRNKLHHLSEIERERQWLDLNIMLGCPFLLTHWWSLNLPVHFAGWIVSLSPSLSHLIPLPFNCVNALSALLQGRKSECVSWFFNLTPLLLFRF